MAHAAPSNGSCTGVPTLSTRLANLRLATVETVDNMIALAFVMLQRRARSRTSDGVVQHVCSRRQLQWLAYRAFQTVFERRQTQHRTLLAWLKASLRSVFVSSDTERRMLVEASACP
ncbi:hypothetical protein T440DRAFT_239477 [Plenodomus tracheiphilus IPT5]|uniref:Uncharacterized protein n=1 Tax=Plenodomus tracheiphilus IPT5 TaxID=1408161 RepID=A0A6A7BJN7_9PLEO|nr:hypothetical protein T440DRAFT_239477 [Plenodomus tracheiphilus IPT5]